MGLRDGGMTTKRRDKCLQGWKWWVYPCLAFYSPWIWKGSYRKICFLINPATQISIIKKKENDNRILECALKGKVDYIVTGDKKHILPLKNFQGIKIVTVAQFLKEFEKWDWSEKFNIYIISVNDRLSSLRRFLLRSSFFLIMNWWGVTFVDDLNLLIK